MGRFKQEHSGSQDYSNLMERFENKGSQDYSVPSDQNFDDSFVSDLSHDDSESSSRSKSRGFRKSLGKIGKKTKSFDGTASLTGSTKRSKKAKKSATSERGPPRKLATFPSGNTSRSKKSAMSDRGPPRNLTSIASGRNLVDAEVAGRAYGADHKTDPERLVKEQSGSQDYSNLMGRFKREHKGSQDYSVPSDQNFDDSFVSDLSHDDSEYSSRSKSRGFRKSLGKFGKITKSFDGTASLGSAASSKKAKKSATSERGPPRSLTTIPSGRDLADADPPAAGRAYGADRKTDPERLAKDAKSRFNMGLVYLKTGDHAKAQENLEQALLCHTKLWGHDSAAYGNDEVFVVAGDHEKLGDCHVADAASGDKRQALDHYEEACRLLRSVDPEDAPPNLTDMLRRVEESMERPELRRAAARKSVAPKTHPPSTTTGHRMEVGDNANALLRASADTGPTADAAGPAKHPTNSKNISPADGLDRKPKGARGARKFFQSLKEGVESFGEDLKEGIEDFAEDLGIKSDSSDDEDSQKVSRLQKSGQFKTAMAQLERENHRTALKTLQSLEEGGHMEDEHFRREVAESMLKVAESASEAKKVGVAVDAYEKSYKILAADDSPDGEKKQLALKGCIRCHKQLAMEMEDKMDLISAIESRARVCQLLDENNRTVPACKQRIILAHHQATRGEYDECSAALSDAARRLKRGVKSVDVIAPDRRDLLIKCLQMQAICCTKSKKWKEALEQYDEVLPLIAKKEGQSGKEYNSALIHKSALLVTLGNHRLAASLLTKYLKLAEISNPDLIVDSVDHLLAIDFFAATQLKAGNVDKAIPLFEQKLAFAKTLPNNPNNKQMKSDTMHKLGCLLANKDQPKKALPLLNQALMMKKYAHDGKHKSVLETMWAVAATNQSLGENGKALKEYTMLLDKMATVDKVPMNVVIVHYSAGKLFFEEGKVEKAVRSFREALERAEASGNLELKSEIKLNLANALSARGDKKDAMDLYEQLLNTKLLKKTRIIFLARFKKSLLLLKMGEAEEARGILNKMAGNRSSAAKDLKGSIFLTLGNLAISDGDIDGALEYFEKSLEAVNVDDFGALADAKRSVAMAQLEAGKADDAILTLEDVLKDISNTNEEGKSINLLKAEVWNCMARVYKKKGELGEAKNFANLALQIYKTELGETNPIALRNRSNLQLILLEEAEGLEKKEAKPIINAAQIELEETLEAFASLDDPWTYRFDVASLKTNLGFIALWRKKPKKAKKLARQVKEVELPPGHPLEHRVLVLGERVEEMMKKKKS